MTKLFYKSATYVATTVAICYAVMNYQLRRELENPIIVDNTDYTIYEQMDNELKMLHTVQKASCNIIGHAILHNEVLFLDDIMEGDDFWIVANFYDSIGEDFFDVCNVSLELGYNLKDFK